MCVQIRKSGPTHDKTGPQSLKGFLTTECTEYTEE